jgi:hypothetical protein
MEQLYYNPDEPTSYAGAAPLVRAARKKQIKRRQVTDWLQTQDTYTLHKPARKRFTRNPYIVFKPFELWQADLNDMRGLSKYNDGVNYLLTVIDVFSKRLYVRSLKKKDGNDVSEAFKQIFKESKTTPRCLQTDKGTEFTGIKTKTLFKKYKIKYVTTQNPDVKAAVVERVNRTLKTRMWRYLTYKNTYRYIDVLDKLVSAYNNSEHKSLGKGIRPIDVSPDNKKIIYRVVKQKFNNIPKRAKPKLKIGDTVRISKEKGIFTKGYETNWSKEVFNIHRVNTLMPLPLYTLIDLKNEELIGQFYEKELQKVTIPKDRTFRIDKILESKGQGRSKRYLVKWEGYGDEFNSWVKAHDLQNV